MELSNNVGMMDPSLEGGLVESASMASMSDSSALLMEPSIDPPPLPRVGEWPIEPDRSPPE
jgi:hypothetical protein